MAELRYSDLVDIMQTRQLRLGLVDQATGQADVAESFLYLYNALLDLAEVSDIPAYTTYNDDIAVTAPGVQSYPLPDDFGRLILPRVRNRRGLYLFDTLSNVDLEYVEPQALVRHTSLVPALPLMFTIIERRLWLFPIPDTIYTIRGTYIKTPARPDLDDPVILPYPSALIERALFRLQADTMKQPGALSQTFQEAQARLVAGSR